MTIIEKIEELNKYCKGSLGIQHFSTGWEISSFADGTLFRFKGELYNKQQDFIRALYFAEVINLAYQAMLDDKKENAK